MKGSRAGRAALREELLDGRHDPGPLLVVGGVDVVEDDRHAQAAISSRTASAAAMVPRRSRWTPMMPKPARAQAFAVAAPNPLLAPRTSAQHSRPSHFNDMVTSRCAVYRRLPPSRVRAATGAPGRRRARAGPQGTRSLAGRRARRPAAV